jgi:hypothetical protein
VRACADLIWAGEVLKTASLCSQSAIFRPCQTRKTRQRRFFHLLPVLSGSIVAFSACSGCISSRASPTTGELTFIAEQNMTQYNPMTKTDLGLKTASVPISRLHYRKSQHRNGITRQ